jgi:dolichol-phosphate mannosyltransferase
MRPTIMMPTGHQLPGAAATPSPASVPAVSVVATVYRDAASVQPLVDELVQVLSDAALTFEIILVDDASPDESWTQIRRAASSSPGVKGLRLRRNHGQHIAAGAGVRESRGDFVVLMDGDLEDPADEIPAMIKRLREGAFDLVYAVEEGGRKRFSSRLFWFVVNRFFNVSIIPHQLMLRVMTRPVADALTEYNELVRTTSAITADITSNHAAWPVKKRVASRPGGSTYDRVRRLKLALDSIIMMTEAPLNMLLLLGLVICVLSFFGVLFYFFAYFFARPLPGYTSLILAISFFGGLTTLMLGFIGRYLANIASEVRRRPLFFVAERTTPQSASSR